MNIFLIHFWRDLSLALGLQGRKILREKTTGTLQTCMNEWAADIGLHLCLPQKSAM